MDLKGKPFYLSADEERWVLDALASMDEREKTGQLFCVMGGDYPLDELRALVSDEGIGAVLYRPCPKAELAEKLAAIDAAARIPLFQAHSSRFSLVYSFDAALEPSLYRISSCMARYVVVQSFFFSVTLPLASL